MIRILSVFGTRPEAIKMAPVIKELERHRDEIESQVCVTAQHRQMLDQVLDVFDIDPDIDLDLMRPKQTLSGLTARALIGLSETVQDIQPDALLVQGDTTTVMAGAMAGFYHQIPVGHVEAGLRTGNLHRPFPEEMNRRVSDTLATFHFAPTATAADALLQEGVAEDTIFVTGNTVIDALFWVLRQSEPAGFAELMVELDGRKLILVTAHRRESFGDPLEQICLGLREVARRNPEIHIVYPVHMNPNVQEPVYRILDRQARVTLVDPLPYPVFVHLMNEAYMVLTDSGGIQEEAPALGKPVLVMRERTERPEAVKAGTVRLVGPSAERIVREMEHLLHDHNAYDRMAIAISPYGDGHAAERIVRVLLERL
jgi:UDP-N-acetylglucosamine 2-epimerase (non-hydrolysing)